MSEPLDPTQAIVNYFVEEGLIPEDMSYDEIATAAVTALELPVRLDDRDREIARLRDEISDRANVEADLRAQLAEEKAKHS